MVAFAYRTEWRKGEILPLTWNRVDFKERAVKLETGETKNSEGRTVYFDLELEKILFEQ